MFVKLKLDLIIISLQREVKNHSVFFEIKKSKSNNLTQDLTNTLDHYKNIVKKLNKLSQKFYLYGAHFPAQLLISLKLDLFKRCAALICNNTLIRAPHHLMRCPIVITLSVRPSVCPSTLLCLAITQKIFNLYTSYLAHSWRMG